MKVIGEFTADSAQEPLWVSGQAYQARWEPIEGFFEVPGISEIKVRVDDSTGEAVVFMRWLVADIRQTGGKEGTLKALDSHSPVGESWARCLRQSEGPCLPMEQADQAIALLALLATSPDYQGNGLGTPLARAFAETVLTRFGVQAFWLEPVPLVEHAATGIFKPKHELDSPKFDQAKARLEKHYERSLGATWSCPNYLRVDLHNPLN